MTKASKRTSKRRVNPLYRPRIRPKVPSASFDGTKFNTHWYPTQNVTIAGTSSSLIMVDGSNTNGGVAPVQQYSAALPFNAIIGNYQTYKYSKLQIKWLPGVAPGVTDAGSRITAAYFDNPEVILNILGTAPAGLSAIVKGARNSVSWNAWESFSYNVPLTTRRKTFDTNSNTTYTIDIIDRSVQGLVLLVCDGINLVATLGQVNISVEVSVHGFETAVFT